MIQNSAPSVVRLCQCDIRIQSKQTKYAAKFCYKNVKVIMYRETDWSLMFAHHEKCYVYICQFFRVAKRNPCYYFENHSIMDVYLVNQKDTIKSPVLTHVYNMEINFIKRVKIDKHQVSSS